MARSDWTKPLPERSWSVALVVAEATLLLLGVQLVALLVVLLVGAPDIGGAAPRSQGLLLIEDAAADLLLVALVGWRMRAWFGTGWRDALGLRATGWRGGRLALLLAAVFAIDVAWSASASVAFESLLGPDASAGSDDPAPAGAELAPWLARRVLLAPVAEEILFRGYLQARLGLVLTPAAGIGLVTFLFALVHFDGEGLLHPIATLSSALYGLVRHRTGSLWPCILMHAIFNAFVSAWEIADP